MKNVLGFTMLLLLSVELSLTSMVKPVPPKKPTSEEEIIIKSLEEAAKLQNIDFECSADSNQTDLHHHSEASSESRRWRDGFFVQIDTAFSAAETALINGALYDLHKILCVGVYLWPKNSSPTGDYVFIQKDTASGDCYSDIGKQGDCQIINLGVGCISNDVITHECIHALGFPHEHKRADRNNYINIYWDNIIPGKEHNYWLSDFETFSVPYDVTSIMHYSSYSFAKDRNRPTIAKKDGGIISYPYVMAASDILKIRRMYNCV